MVPTAPEVALNLKLQILLPLSPGTPHLTSLQFVLKEDLLYETSTPSQKAGNNKGTQFRAKGDKFIASWLDVVGCGGSWPPLLTL